MLHINGVMKNQLVYISDLANFADQPKRLISVVAPQYKFIKS